MKNKTLVVLISCALIFCLGLWWYSRPVVRASCDTPLWATEYDASRQYSSNPGSGVPLGKILEGDQVRFLWASTGKDYRAFNVVVPRLGQGWVLYGQDGIGNPSL